MFIPTKNRTLYLEETLATLVGFQDPRVEIVVHDNSDDAAVLNEIVSGLAWPHLRLEHSHETLSQTGNSDRAAVLASGMYVTYLGDDDCITPAFVDMVQALADSDIEAANFPFARYYWPDVVFKGHQYPSLSIPLAETRCERVDVAGALQSVLRRGGTGLGDLPRVYHGVVRRDVLTSVYTKSGSNFPGPSPDMANGAALAVVSETLVHLPVPVLVNGVGYHSAGGRGVRGEHKASLKDVEQLPPDVEDDWDPRIPKVWLGPTIWAQSLVTALRRMGQEARTSDLSLFRLYAFVLAFHPDCWRQVVTAGVRAPFALMGALVWVVFTFAWRSAMFVKNRWRRTPAERVAVVADCASISSAVAEADLVCRSRVNELGGWATVVGTAKTTSQQFRRPSSGRLSDALPPAFLVLLLSAGYMKGHPLLSWLPFDLTAAAAVLTLLALVHEAATLHDWFPPRGGGAVVALVVLSALGYLVAPTSEYAEQKRILLLLTLISALGGLYLVRSRLRLIWLLRWTVGVGLVVVLFVWVSPVNVYGRVSFEGGGTISVARATGGALLALLALTVGRSVRIWVAAGLAIPLVLTLSGTGQRAPLLAVGIALLVVGVFRPGPRRLRRAIVTFAALGLAGAVAYAAAGEAGRSRLQLLFEADKGASASVREEMWSRAWGAVWQHPLGMGWGELGGVIAPFQHPHNLVLEISAEAGWAAGVTTIAVVLLAVVRIRRLAEDPYAAGLMMLLVFVVFNALVSGDVTENRAVFAYSAIALVAPWALRDRHPSKM